VNTEIPAPDAHARGALDAGPPRRPRADAWRRFVRNRVAAAAFGVVVVASLTAVLAPAVSPFDPALQNPPLSNLPPSAAHLLGTDQYGRDVLSRLIYGARISLSVGLVSVTILIVVGTALGALAGYQGGAVDQTVMRFVDVMLSLPQYFLLLAVVAVFGPSLINTMAVIGLTGWMGTARLVRAHVLTLRHREFGLAARAAGATPTRIIVRHMLPNTIPLIIVQAALSFSFAILVEASLSYLGLGAQPPTASWGNMLNDGKDFISSAWWLTFFPGLAVFLTVLSFNLIGDHLRELLDPRLRRTNV